MSQVYVKLCVTRTKHFQRKYVFFLA